MVIRSRPPISAARGSPILIGQRFNINKDCFSAHFLHTFTDYPQKNGGMDDNGTECTVLPSADERLCAGQRKSPSPSTSSAKGKTAQYYRDYRARKKAELQNIKITIEPKKKKTPAEYQRQCRARKKAAMLAKELQAAAPIDPLIVENPEGFLLVLLDADGPPVKVEPDLPTDLTKTKTRKTNAEYQKAYRERQKSKRNAILAQLATADSSDAEYSAGPYTSDGPRRKTAAQYQREYRARKKAKLESTSTLSSPTCGDSPKVEISANVDDIGDDLCRLAEELVRLNPRTSCLGLHQHGPLHDCLRPTFPNNPLKLSCFHRRLWFQDMEESNNLDAQMQRILPNAKSWKTCFASLRLSCHNESESIKVPDGLPDLASITERLVPVRILFKRMQGLDQIRGRQRILGETGNGVLDAMVKHFPRNIRDRSSIGADARRRDTRGLRWTGSGIGKRIVRRWLKFFKDTSLYRRHLKMNFESV